MTDAGDVNVLVLSDDCDSVDALDDTGSGPAVVLLSISPSYVGESTPSSESAELRWCFKREFLCNGEAPERG